MALDDLFKGLEYSVEDAVKFYTEYIKEKKEKSRSMGSFFLFFDPEKKEFVPREEIRKLSRYKSNFYNLKERGIITPMDLNFEDWVKQQISIGLKQELEELTSKYQIREWWSLEQGVEFYIDHLKQYKEHSKIIRSFFIFFRSETDEIPSNVKICSLRRHYDYFSRNKKKGKSPRGLEFQDYIIQNLPEEKRAEAAYYLKGQYLKDCLKEKLGSSFIKDALLGGN
jgi:hypothetical protein